MSDVDLLLLPACEQARRIARGELSRDALVARQRAAIGLQVMGRRGADFALLGLAAQLEGILASAVPPCR